MVQSPFASHRSASLSIFHQLLATFDDGARFHLLTSALVSCPYPAVAALMIHQLKEEVFAIWSVPSVAATSANTSAATLELKSPFASSVVITSVIGVMSVTDVDALLAAMDSIGAALNFLRFLLLRVNATSVDPVGLNALQKDISTTVLLPLQTLVIQFSTLSINIATDFLV
jgi:hypothetical protein